MKIADIALCCACAMSVVGSRPCAAADASLDEIVITATRVPERLGATLEPVIVIDRTELGDSLALDIGDVLRFHSGLDIDRYGGPGQPLTVFIRGANSNESIIMIDGVRVNSGTQALGPLMNLAPELFDRIEVVKGPRSAIYGTDAIGGVVNLITRDAAETGADLMLDYGRYGTGEFALDGSYRSGDTSLQAVLSGQQSAGFPSFAGDTLDAGYKNLSGTAAIVTHVDGVEIGARFYEAHGATQYAAANYNESYTAFTSFTPQDELFSNTLLAVHASGDVTDLWHSRLTLSRVVDDLRQQQDDVDATAAVGDFDYTSRDTLDFQNDFKFKSGPLDQVVTAGAILADEHTNSLSYGTGYSIDTNTRTFYAEDQLTAGRDRLLLALGETHHPAFGDHTTYNAEYGYSVTADTLVILSVGTAFRAPTATDRFGFGGNPNLEPESSRNLEIDLKQRIDAGQELNFAAFQNRITDLIVSVFNPANLLFYGYENENVDLARIRGLEASWDYRRDPWALHVEGSLQDPRDLVTNSGLLRRSKHSFTLEANRSAGIMQGGVDLMLSGPRPDEDIVTGNPVQDGGYLLVALHAKLAVSSAWTLSARVDNAFDRRYQLADGYNTAGRSLSVATRYSFR